MADSYREISWKKSTRAARFKGSFIILKSAKVKIRHTDVFLHNNENKSQLIKLFFNWIIDNRRKTLNTLRTKSLYLSAEGYCQRLSTSNVSSIDSPVSTHVVADLYLWHMRNMLGDTDIFILALASFYSANLILYSDTVARREIVGMSDAEIEEDNRNALIGFHAFTGCDYTSSFFHSSKTKSWKTMNSKSRFKEVMTRLGENGFVHDDLCRTLGGFACTMYGGGHMKDVNTLRFYKFTEKQNRENKYVHLSALLPCQATLKLHRLHANRVAYLMKKILSYSG